jgi:hypothetical protein
MAENVTGIRIGDLPIALHCTDSGFLTQLRARYADFLCDPNQAPLTLDIIIKSSDKLKRDADVNVNHCANGWRIRRGDFLAHWNPATGYGSVVQTANLYSVDSVLRIIHTLALAECGGFLLHSASVVHHGRALLLTGPSGAGKTTITRLAPSSVIRLSDEISYVRQSMSNYIAHGTPFSGELNTPGENTSAPVAGIYFLMHAGENRIEPIAPPDAVSRLMRNVLFFVKNGDLPGKVFRSACEFIAAVPAFTLYFRPEAKIWELFA